MLEIERNEILKICSQKHFSIQNNILRTVLDNFTLRDLDDILNHSPLVPSDFLLFKNSNKLPNEQFLNNEKVFIDKNKLNSFIQNEDFSLKIFNVDRYNHFLSKFKLSLAISTNHKVTINLYLTPSTSPCFSEHQDPYNIFIVQVDGEKKWYLNNHTSNIPLTKTQMAELIKDGDCLTLKKGDILHLPPAILHKAENITNQPSLHLTIGLHPITYEDVFYDIIQSKKAVLFSKQSLRYENGTISMNATKESFLKYFESYFSEDIFNEQINDILTSQTNTSSANFNCFNLNQTLRCKSLNHDSVFMFNLNQCFISEDVSKKVIFIKSSGTKYRLHISLENFNEMYKDNTFTLSNFIEQDHKTLNSLYLNNIIALRNE